MNNFKTYILFLTSLACFSVSIAQVEFKEPVIFTSPNNEDRQVKNLADPTTSDNGVNVQTYQSGKLVYAPASGTSNNITVDLAPAISSYNAGMIVNFKAQSTNTGAITINVNGLGSVSLKKAVVKNIDSAEILSGQMVSAIYDGTNFQILSRLAKVCPNGFVEVTKDYCIEIEERDTATFWEANKVCGDLNGKLCTMGEWAGACQKGYLGINNMLNNYEWVDSAANKNSSGHTAKTMGMLSTGVPGCNNGYNALPSRYKNYRCCFSK